MTANTDLGASATGAQSTDRRAAPAHIADGRPPDIASGAMNTMPVTLLTGFLGSGKTTLLRRLLSETAANGTALLINEVGEIGLDHLLVGPAHYAGLLHDGCVCCSLRTDLEQGLSELLDRSAPSLQRVVIETTGLADPVPIVDFLVNHPALRERVSFAGTVTTIDAVHGSAQLDQHVEPVRQAAMADRLVITKSDLASRAGVTRLRRRLKNLNTTAKLFDAQAPDFRPGALLTAGLVDLTTRVAEVTDWLRSHEGGAPDVHADHHHGQDRDQPHGHAEGPHDPRIRTFSVRATEPIEWPALAMWLNSLVRRYGPSILRIKGLLNIVGAPGSVVLHGIQHVIPPLAPLESWPDDDISSRIVFVVQDIDPRPIHDSLLALLARRSRAARWDSPD